MLKFDSFTAIFLVGKNITPESISLETPGRVSTCGVSDTFVNHLADSMGDGVGTSSCFYFISSYVHN